VTPPDLPSGFWSGFPNNVLPATSPWKQIGPHKIVPSVEAGKAQIVGFEWPVPATAPTNISLLAIITADNDSLSTSELNVSTLVTNNKKCGLKNMAILNPSPTAGPPVNALSLNVAHAGTAKKYSLGVDRGGASMIRGVVLSKRLSALAKKAKLPRMKLTDADKDELFKLIEATPSLKKQLDLKTAYAPREGVWLENVPLNSKQNEPLVAFVTPSTNNRLGSLIQWGDDGTAACGLTIQSNKED
jgi:hypothetical protein